MKPFSRYRLLLCGLSFLSLVAGCGRIVGHFTSPLFDDLTRSFMQQGDVVIAEQGTPAFLLVLDGLIEHSPESKDILLAGAQAYSAYTAAFVGSKEPERNKRLTAKARDYALRALSLHSKRFAKVKDAPYPEFVTCLDTFKKKDVPFVFYSAASWAGWIQAHSDSMDAIADLPRVQALIERVIELDEAFYYGASHTFMGVLLTVRPPSLGGRPEEAREHFERALELGQGKTPYHPGDVREELREAHVRRRVVLRSFEHRPGFPCGRRARTHTRQHPGKRAGPRPDRRGPGRGILRLSRPGPSEHLPIVVCTSP